MTRAGVETAGPDRTEANQASAVPVHWPTARIVAYPGYRALVPTREIDRACGKRGASDEQPALLD